MSRRDAVAEENEDALFFDGFDEAIVGYARRCGQPTLAVYDYDRCIDALERGGMTREEAEEYFEYNVVGAWAGPHTPLVLYRIDPEH